jgi:hypothetical protein
VAEVMAMCYKAELGPAKSSRRHAHKKAHVDVIDFEKQFYLYILSNCPLFPDSFSWANVT